MLTRRALFSLFAAAPLVRVPVDPARLRAEQTILGCMWADPSLRWCRCLEPEDFHDPVLRDAFKGLSGMTDQKPLHTELAERCSLRVKPDDFRSAVAMLAKRRRRCHECRRTAEPLRPEPSARRRDLERRIIGCMLLAPLLRKCRCLAPDEFSVAMYRRAYVLLTSDAQTTPEATKLYAECVDDLPEPSRFHDYVDALGGADEEPQEDLGSCP